MITTTTKKDDLSMDSLMSESFIKTEGPGETLLKEQQQPKPKTGTAKLIDDQLNRLKNLKQEGSKLAQVILQDRTNEKMAENSKQNPYLVEGLINPPAPILKKRGRPRKDGNSSSIGSLTPERNVSFGPTPTPASSSSSSSKTPPRTKTPPPPSPSPSAKEYDPSRDINKKLRRIKQIIQISKIYPHLVSNGIAPPPHFDYHSLSIEELDRILSDCKKNGYSGQEGMEYEAIKTIFLKVLDNFEIVSSLILSFFKPTETPNPLIVPLIYFSRQPNGSFSRFVKSSIDTGDDIDSDLREIAVDFIGLMPESPYLRLAIKLAYKVYDYNNFITDHNVSRNADLINSKLSGMSPEELAALYSQMEL